MKEISKKIIIAGPKSAGKSALLHRLIHDEFNDSSTAPKGMQVDRTIAEHSGKKINLVLWDLDGDTNKEDTPDTYFLGANAILYVVNPGDPEHLENLTQDLKQLKLIVGETPIMLVANQSDAIDKKSLREKLMSLDQQPDIFCSAKTGEGIDDLYKNALGLAMAHG